MVMPLIQALKGRGRTEFKTRQVYVRISRLAKVTYFVQTLSHKKQKSKETNITKKLFVVILVCRKLNQAKFPTQCIFG